MPERTDKKAGEPISRVLDAFVNNHRALKGFIARFSVGTQDVEDIAQEAFARAYAAERDLPIDHPKAFLFSVARNVAVSELRSKSRTLVDQIEEIATDSALAVGWSAEDEAIGDQQLGIHCEAVASLPHKCRQAYLLRKVYGLSHKEIANRMGIARSTVEKHLMKGVALCDAYFAADGRRNLPATTVSAADK